jgi:hypothetical protein
MTLNVPVPPVAGKVDGADVADREMLHEVVFSSAATVFAAAPFTVSAMVEICTPELVLAAAVNGTDNEVLAFVPELGEAVRNELPDIGVIATLQVHPTSLKVRFRVPLPPEGYMK